MFECPICGKEDCNCDFDGMVDYEIKKLRDKNAELQSLNRDLVENLEIVTQELQMYQEEHGIWHDEDILRAREVLEKAKKVIK